MSSHPDLPGGFEPPYRPGCGARPTQRGCWSHRKASDLIDSYANITTVQKDNSGTVDPANAPFSRNYSFQPGDDPGDWGVWVGPGDKNGPPTQVVTACTPDINETEDSVDHNTYSAEPTGTLDFRLCHQIGWQGVKAHKYWHGIFGPQSEFYNAPDYTVDADGYVTDTSYPSVEESPDQTRYLSMATVMDMTLGGYELETFIETFGNYTLSKTATVGRLTGIRTIECAETSDPGPFPPTFDWSPYIAAQARWTKTDAIIFFNNRIASDTGTGLGYRPWSYSRTGSIGEWVRLFTDDDDAFELVGEMAETVTIDFATGDCHRILRAIRPGSPSDIYVAKDEEVTFSATQMLYTYVGQNLMYTDTESPHRIYTEADLTITTDYTVEYTATQCFSDFIDALAQWDMADLSLAPFRPDELLAMVPLVIYDEAASGLPDLTVPCTMDDYNDPVADSESVEPWAEGWVPTWGQIPWLDNQSYYWLYDDTCTTPPAMWASATLVTGVRTGEIISHLNAGQGRHFWFGFVHQERIFGPAWQADFIGQDSQAPLPRVTMRWEDEFAMIYDSEVSEKAGNYPQSWLRQSDSLVEGCKYVETKEFIPSVNFARPGGSDKFAIDNPTACWIKEADESDPDAIIFRVRSTQGANEPDIVDGINVGDFIIVTGDTAPGIYQIASITGPSSEDDGGGLMRDIYDVTVGPKLDDLPSGFIYDDARDEDDYLGALRWWTAPGLMGRAACTIPPGTAGVITITTSAAQPYLRSGEVVDVCDASMSVLAASVTVERTSDTTWTATHADISGAAYLVPHRLHDGTTPGTKYYFNDAKSKRSFVQFNWEFNLRGVAQAAPPAWYEGVEGCTTMNLAETCVEFSPCHPAIVGIVPSGSGVDSFEVQELSDMPTTFPFDATYGALWLGQIQTAMNDPFWQTPFAPDAEALGTVTTLSWRQDDGSGMIDTIEGTVLIKYYAFPTQVEALSVPPSTYGPGSNEAPPTLSAGITLDFDPANVFDPPYYPHGIPYGYDTAPNLGVVRAFGTIARACASTRFTESYGRWVIC